MEQMASEMQIRTMTKGDIKHRINMLNSIIDTYEAEKRAMSQEISDLYDMLDKMGKLEREVV